MEEIQMSTKLTSSHQENSASSPVVNPTLNPALSNWQPSGRSISLNTVVPEAHKVNKEMTTLQKQPSSITNPVNVNPNHLNELRMAKEIHRCIMLTIGAMPTERGGLLLGPIDSNDVTDFYLDITAQCTGGTYTPDHKTLSQKMEEEWIPSGIDMKGFVHSHPNGLDSLSSGDLSYIARLLKANDDMTIFSAPIVLPDHYRFCPFIVHRERPRAPVRAELVLF